MISTTSSSPAVVAPVVLFVFRRPWHTRQTLMALQANDLAAKSVLYIYSDSPRHLAPQEDFAKVAEVRRICRSQQWCREVHVIEAPHNKGLVMSFVDGITEVVNRHGRVIVLEEDQYTSKGFLKFMNEALEMYKDDEQVLHVSGYMYPAAFECKSTTFFLQIQSCPGWGTWKRAWAHYNHDCDDHYQYFSRRKKLQKKFDIEGHAYFYKQLLRNRHNVQYSWAVRWHASCIRANGLLLFPAKSLVKNIGCDGTGEHCGGTRMYDVETVDYLAIRREPIVENQRIRRAVDIYYKKHLQGGRSDFGVTWEKARRQAAAWLVQTVRRPLRQLFSMVYPELRQLDLTLAREIGLLSAHDETTIAPTARVFPPCRLSRTSVGDCTYVMPQARIDAARIGKFCSIGSHFTCGIGLHPDGGISTSPVFYAARPPAGRTLCGIDKIVPRRPVTIGNDVFIGDNVTILEGVTVGDGAVIGAGAVVGTDVDPFAIVVGNPAHVVTYRFSQDARAKMMSMQWWDWPADRLGEIERAFFDVDRFVAKGGEAQPEGKRDSI